jgi:putative Holliday junction resolvase
MDEDNLPPRILAIDPGTKRMGLAVSDPFGNFAVGLETLHLNPKQDDPVPRLAAICEQYGVGRVVIGLPLHMSGQPGEGARLAGELARKVEAALNLPVELMDERLTSRLAEISLRRQNIQSSRHRKSGLVDQVAAMLLLQDYLDRRVNIGKIGNRPKKR